MYVLSVVCCRLRSCPEKITSRIILLPTYSLSRLHHVYSCNKPTRVDSISTSGECLQMTLVKMSPTTERLIDRRRWKGRTLLSRCDRILLCFKHLSVWLMQYIACRTCREANFNHIAICCEEGQRWKLCHVALTVDYRAGCSSCSMTNN